MNLIDFQLKFSNEDSCREWLIEKKYGKEHKIYCPHCHSYHICNHKTRYIYTCLDCKKQFSIRIGTIFECSRLPLYKWFISIFLFTSLKKGISSLQLAKYIGTTQKTAWFVLQRIREVMKDKEDNTNNNSNNKSKGIIELDETYIGGKSENMHMSKGIEKKGKFEKEIIFGMIERNGKVKAKQVKDTKSNALLPEIYNNIQENSLIITDELNTYKGIGFSYCYRNVNHSENNYAKISIYKNNKLSINTNTIEGFWSIMKRGINGIYHWASKKHLQKYVNKFSFRYNIRKFDDYKKFDFWFNNFYIRLKYKELIK